MRLAALFLLLAAALAAQPLTVGLKAGVPFIDPNGSNGNSPKIAAGASIELALPARCAIELSAIHRRTDQTFFSLPSPGAFSNGVLNQIRGSSWEFPLLAKYYFGPRTTRWQPFLGAGAAVRTIGYQLQGATLSPSHCRTEAASKPPDLTSTVVPTRRSAGCSPPASASARGASPSRPNSG
jgi:hypothetical protein